MRLSPGHLWLSLLFVILEFTILHRYLDARSCCFGVLLSQAPHIELVAVLQLFRRRNLPPFSEVVAMLQILVVANNIADCRTAKDPPEARIQKDLDHEQVRVRCRRGIGLASLLAFE